VAWERSECDKSALFASVGPVIASEEVTNLRNIAEPLAAETMDREASMQFALEVARPLK
jgi:hypothetical protein